MNFNTPLKISYNHILLFGVAAILTTQLRISLLLVAPLLIVVIMLAFRMAVRTYILTLGSIILASYLISLSNGFYFGYNFLSLFYTLPFLLLVFAKPKKTGVPSDLFPFFFISLTALMVLNNLIGIFQYINFPNDDSFSGLYGKFTITQNGLSIINSILFFYYLKMFQAYRKRKYLLWFIFFAISTIMGFYGGGMLAFIAAFALYKWRFTALNISKSLIIIVTVAGLISLTMYIVSPDTLRYNKNIISRFLGNSNEPAPRKLTAHANYIQAYSHHPIDMAFGSGPGTFNSRSAFMIGSPDYFRTLDFFKSDDKPYYFNNYAYTLWNSANTGRFHDGFMNQPFSSVLAFLGEYGLIFTLAFFFFYYKQFRTVSAYSYISPEDLPARDLYQFCSIFLVLLLIIDNYVEYPEIMIFILLIMKLAEKQLLNDKEISA